MNTVPRRFALVYAKFAQLSKETAQMYRRMLDENQLMYCEFICLCHWLSQEETSNEDIAYSDPERAALAERWNACAERCDCDLEDSNDPEWHAVEAETEAWYEKHQLRALRRVGLHDVARLRRAFPTAYEELVQQGRLSLEGDKAVVPDWACDSERYDFTFQWTFKPKTDLKVA